MKLHVFVSLSGLFGRRDDLLQLGDELRELYLALMQLFDKLYSDLALK